ncbi:bifunctional aminoglycoside phosphotransferase/ATP-binding protein [Thiohalobacter sp. COW1]|uniref:bifunctional aminoglycoside phosphotransferase/ATP-binding protein n=1 Tax=Thiohalobacter sp. COW1 TaxID=2795687 RepID=UPI001F5BC2FF|nr:bifunctional aminoglycoside phosphotransferase/ATP-binding protein [Thiohalobacter sp. COW1]
MSATASRLETIITALQSAERFPHPVGDFRVIETHISYILLTGGIAYKFKKPVDLGFLDFSTLEQRREDCEVELELNRRLAPALYLDVVAVTGTPEDPQLGGTGEPIEYALKMKQFDDTRRLDRLAAREELTTDHIDQLAATLAAFHRSLPPASPDSGYGSFEGIAERIRENFNQIDARIDEPALLAELEPLREWSETQLEQHQDDMEQRRREGWIRECHGDLHLANMVDIDGGVEIFDCLEFSPDLRWIDTLSEIAFLLMDLDYQGQHNLAWRFLNEYLEYANDYMGLSLLNDYRVYRAMVRAKVAAIECEQHRDDTERAEAARHQLVRHLKLARAYTQNHGATPIVLMHGLSGSGKSRLAQQLAETCNCIRIRSDVERKRLLGLSPLDSTHAQGADAYSPSLTRKTYQRLQALAYGIVDAGLPVFVDATFLMREQRQNFQRLAQVAGIPLVILDVAAPEPVLRQRIQARARSGGDPSEADLAVLDQQLEHQEPLTGDERRISIVVDTSTEVDLERLVSEILQRARIRPSG